MVKYGVLGLLIERRGYGYDLVQRLARRLGVAWQLNPSAVYTALDQLEQEKLIEAVPSAAEPPASERRQRRPGRVVYQATETGEAEFRAWLSRPSERVDPIRSELQLKVALAGPDNVPPLLASIAHEEWLIAQQLHVERTALGFAAPSEARPYKIELSSESNETGTWSTAAAALVNAAAMTRLRGELAWLQAVRETLQRMSTKHVSAIAQVELPDAATLG